MALDWTPAQRAAIELEGPDLLVSAGAGAGKTAVLVERVIRRVVDHQRQLPVERLLVVTFNEEAAGQMRRRIRDRLEGALAEEPESQWLRRQLGLLGRAQISTLHAFCLQLVRRYFHRLELDPGARVMGEHETRLLERQVLDDVFEDAYAAGDETFLQLVEAYGGRGDERLWDRVLALHNLAYSQPWPERWLDRILRPFQTAGAQLLEDSPWYPVVRKQLLRTLAQAEYAVAQARRLAAEPGGPAPWLPVLAADRERLAAARQELDRRDWDAGVALLAEVAGDWPRLPAARDVEPDLHAGASGARNRAKELVRGAAGGLANRSSEEFRQELRTWAPLGAQLVKLAVDFHQAYNLAKGQASLLDFADMERHAFRLLQDPDGDPGRLQPSVVARQLHGTYHEVLVDEYQDINELQDAIIQLIAHGDGSPGGLFLVGDVKQSIYRFRLAEPELFVARYRAYPPLLPGESAGDAAGDGPDGEQAPGTEGTPRVRQGRIDLNHNFRSRPPILAAVNFAFRQLMRPQLGGIVYDDAAALRPGLTYPEPPEGAAAETGDVPVEVHLMERAVDRGDVGQAQDADVDTDGEDAGQNTDLEATTALEREGALLARRIQVLVHGGDGREPLAIWDPDQARYRPARYRDIVILLRAARRQADVLQDVLQRMGVPVYARAATGFFQALEVEVMVALLQLLDNPRQEIAMATVLRSPVVGLDPDALARIRLADPDVHFTDAVTLAAAGEGPRKHRLRPADRETLTTFVERLDRWRGEARRGPLSHLLAGIYAETGLVTYVTGMPGGAQRRANLLGLLERARQFNGFHRQGLFRFLRFLERLREREEDLAAAPVLGEGQDVVRVMTIHQSKGLEFPVVFVANLGGGFTLDSGDLLLDRRLGFGPRLVDLEQRIRYPTFAYHGVREELRLQGLAEELRLLYVAMTRARERLILVGSVRGLDAAVGHWVHAGPEEGWALPDPVVLEAGTFLDWLGPVLARHPDGEPLRRLVRGADGSPELLDHPSRWSLRLWLAPDLAQVAPAPPAPPDEAELWQRVAAARPLAGREPGRLAPRLETAINWEYPYRGLVERPAKLAATEVKGIMDPEAEVHPSPARLREILAEGPRFARMEQDGGSAEEAATRGKAVHRALQLVDLDGPLDEAGIAAQLEVLVAGGALRGELAALVQPEQLARFFASAIGRRVVAAPGRVAREVMFTMQVPAGELYPELDDGASEGVVVQGIIDCLVREDDGYLLIDFKTDRLPEDVELAAYARRYATQLALYRRAVVESTGHPVRDAVLYFLATGEPLRLD